VLSPERKSEHELAPSGGGGPFLVNILVHKGDCMMADTRIVLAGLWVATMLTYLLGDVLRIMAGDIEPGKLQGGIQATQGMWLLIAGIMLVPIVMLVLTLTLPYPAIRWVNIVVAILVVVLNLFGLPYKGAYDNFLIVVSFVFNALTVWYAWKWVV
jgi:hypothetical protein